MSSLIRYKLRSGETGSGEMVNISGSGALFRGEDDLPVGQRIRITLPWPAALEGGCQLQLIIAASVVRSDDRGTAVEIHWHEFHTKKRLSYALT